MTWNNEAPPPPLARSAASRSLSLRIVDAGFQLLVIACIAWTLLGFFHLIAEVPVGYARNEYLSELWPSFATGYLWLLVGLCGCAIVSRGLKRKTINKP